MTIINVQSELAPTVSGLTAESDPVGSGINLDWKVPIDARFHATEVWVSQTNDRNAALQVGTVLDNHFFYFGSQGVTYYFWVRGVNIYNQANGVWYPASASAGVSATVKYTLITGKVVSNDSQEGFTIMQTALRQVVRNQTAVEVPVAISFWSKITYVGGVVPTEWQLYDSTTGSIINNFGIFYEKMPFIVINWYHVVPANTSISFSMRWRGDSTVSLSSRSLLIDGRSI